MTTHWPSRHQHLANTAGTSLPPSVLHCRGHPFPGAGAGEHALACLCGARETSTRESFGSVSPSLQWPLTSSCQARCPTRTLALTESVLAQFSPLRLSRNLGPPRMPQVPTRQTVKSCSDDGSRGQRATFNPISYGSASCLGDTHFPQTTGWAGSKPFDDLTIHNTGFMLSWWQKVVCVPHGQRQAFHSLSRLQPCHHSEYQLQTAL